MKSTSQHPAVIVDSGSIVVITGPMMAGKTTTLIHSIQYASLIRGQTALVYRPSIDTRSSDDVGLQTHTGITYPSTRVSTASEIERDVTDVCEKKCLSLLVAIDEAQFFDDALPDVVTRLALFGCAVIIAGLSIDAQSVPFGVMPHLLSIADDVRVIHGVCSTQGCPRPARYTARRGDPEKPSPQILIGGSDLYVVRCRVCLSNK